MNQGSIVQCIVCKRPFFRVTQRSPRAILPRIHGGKIRVRGAKCVTCSKPCSRIYVYGRYDRNIRKELLAK